MEGLIFDERLEILHNGSKWNREENTVTITVKNVPEEIYERIKLQAKVNRRSVNSEIVSIFERTVPTRTPMDVEKNTGTRSQS